MLKIDEVVSKMKSFELLLKDNIGKGVDVHFKNTEYFECGVIAEVGDNIVKLITKNLCNGKKYTMYILINNLREIKFFEPDIFDANGFYIQDEEE